MAVLEKVVEDAFDDQVGGVRGARCGQSIGCRCTCDGVYLIRWYFGRARDRLCQQHCFAAQAGKVCSTEAVPNRRGGLAKRFTVRSVLAMASIDGGAAGVCCGVMSSLAATPLGTLYTGSGLRARLARCTDTCTPAAAGRCGMCVYNTSSTARRNQFM